MLSVRLVKVSDEGEEDNKLFSSLKNTNPIIKIIVFIGLFSFLIAFLLYILDSDTDSRYLNNYVSLFSDIVQVLGVIFGIIIAGVWANKDFEEVKSLTAKYIDKLIVGISIFIFLLICVAVVPFNTLLSNIKFPTRPTATNAEISVNRIDGTIILCNTSGRRIDMSSVEVDVGSNASFTLGDNFPLSDNTANGDCWCLQQVQLTNTTEDCSPEKTATHNIGTEWRNQTISVVNNDIFIVEECTGRQDEQNEYRC